MPMVIVASVVFNFENLLSLTSGFTEVAIGDVADTNLSYLAKGCPQSLSHRSLADLAESYLIYLIDAVIVQRWPADD